MNEKTGSRLLESAYRYLSYKPRSVFEIRNYLKNKKAADDEIEWIIEHLQKKEFLNDQRYAVWYIENRAKFNPRSVFALQYELRQKGIPPSISEPILSGYSDYELAQKTVTLRQDRWKRLDREQLKKKLMNHLRYRGFSYSVGKEMFEQFIQKDTQ